MTKKKYRLRGPNGLDNLSDTPGKIGGHSKLKIYGRLDCPSALRHLEKGQYAKHRIFFANEDDAISNGYRPCGVCMPHKYKIWKASGEPGSENFPWLKLPLKKSAKGLVGLKMTREEIIRTIQVIDNVGMTDEIDFFGLNDDDLLDLLEKVAVYAEERQRAFANINQL